MATNNAINANATTPLASAYGGTGVNNGSSLFTMGGNVTFSGAFPFVGVITASTNVTFPTSGTLATLADIPSASGTVNAGSINQLAWYAANGDAVSALTGANSAMLVTNASGVPAMTASLTNGQVIIGFTGGTPAPATLTAGPGISIANGPGSITISGTGSGIGWTEVTAATQAMTADNGYIANNAGGVTFTLPATAALGTAIDVLGKGAGGWIIEQNAGQNIQIGNVSSTVGATGSIESTNEFDSITLICTTADTTWTALGGPQSAGITIN